MRQLKVTVGGPIEEEPAARFIGAWHRAERGESFCENHLAFESWETLTRVLTRKRLALLRHVHRHPLGSVRALAQALGRDCSNVHADVRALAEAGLLSIDEQGLHADYDAIETSIAI